MNSPRNTIRTWACIVAIFSASCGGSGGDGEGGLGAVFASLNGRYRINRAMDCFVRILGSRVTVENGSGARCRELDYYDRWESLEVNGTLTDTRISGTLEYVREDADPDPECPYGRTYVAMADADRVEGRSSSGRFEALAGSWSGSVRIMRHATPCVVEQPDREPMPDTERVFRFDAEVDGREAIVHYWEVDLPDDVSTIEVFDLDGEDILFNGDTVEVDR